MESLLKLLEKYPAIKILEQRDNIQKYQTEKQVGDISH
jgi:hypothetical protein